MVRNSNLPYYPIFVNCFARIGSLCQNRQICALSSLSSSSSFECERSLPILFCLQFALVTVRTYVRSFVTVIFLDLALHYYCVYCNHVMGIGGHDGGGGGRQGLKQATAKPPSNPIHGLAHGIPEYLFAAK